MDYIKFRQWSPLTRPGNLVHPGVISKAGLPASAFTSGQAPQPTYQPPAGVEGVELDANKHVEAAKSKIKMHYHSSVGNDAAANAEKKKYDSHIASGASPTDKHMNQAFTEMHPGYREHFQRTTHLRMSLKSINELVSKAKPTIVRRDPETGKEHKIGSKKFKQLGEKASGVSEKLKQKLAKKDEPREDFPFKKYFGKWKSKTPTGAGVRAIGKPKFSDPKDRPSEQPYERRIEASREGFSPDIEGAEARKRSGKSSGEGDKPKESAGTGTKTATERVKETPKAKPEEPKKESETQAEIDKRVSGKIKGKDESKKETPKMKPEGTKEGEIDKEAAEKVKVGGKSARTRAREIAAEGERKGTKAAGEIDTGTKAATEKVKETPKMKPEEPKKASSGTKQGTKTLKEASKKSEEAPKAEPKPGEPGWRPKARNPETGKWEYIQKEEPKKKEERGKGPRPTSTRPLKQKEAEEIISRKEAKGKPEGPKGKPKRPTFTLEDTEEGKKESVATGETAKEQKRAVAKVKAAEAAAKPKAAKPKAEGFAKLQEIAEAKRTGKFPDEPKTEPPKSTTVEAAETVKQTPKAKAKKPELKPLGEPVPARERKKPSETKTATAAKEMKEATAESKAKRAPKGPDMPTRKKRKPSKKKMMKEFAAAPARSGAQEVGPGEFEGAQAAKRREQQAKLGGPRSRAETPRERGLTQEQERKEHAGKLQAAAKKTTASRPEMKRFKEAPPRSGAARPTAKEAKGREAEFKREAAAKKHEGAEQKFHEQRMEAKRPSGGRQVGALGAAYERAKQKVSQIFQRPEQHPHPAESAAPAGARLSEKTAPAPQHTTGQPVSAPAAHHIPASSGAEHFQQLAAQTAPTATPSVPAAQPSAPASSPTFRAPMTFEMPRTATSTGGPQLAPGSMQRSLLAVNNMIKAAGGFKMSGGTGGTAKKPFQAKAPAASKPEGGGDKPSFGSAFKEAVGAPAGKPSALGFAQASGLKPEGARGIEVKDKPWSPTGPGTPKKTPGGEGLPKAGTQTGTGGPQLASGAPKRGEAMDVRSAAAPSASGKPAGASKEGKGDKVAPVGSAYGSLMGLGSAMGYETGGGRATTALATQAPAYAAFKTDIASPTPSYSQKQTSTQRVAGRSGGTTSAVGTRGTTKTSGSQSSMQAKSLHAHPLVRGPGALRPRQ
jgi:histone H1/5